MTSVIMQKINPEDVYNKLVDINGYNGFGLTMTYFDSLYSHKDFWSNRHPYGLSPKYFKTYVEFAKYEVPWGLGWDIDVIKAHCKRKPNIWQEHEEQINPLKTNGGRRHLNECDISHSNVERGSSSRQYQIQRLKRDAPDIAIKVIEGELSAKQGMEIAGLKDRTVVVKCKAEDFVVKAINNLETNQIEKLVQDLSLYLKNISL
jgi:hypothetical protein